MLTPVELRDLSRVSDGRSLLALTLDWLGIVLLFYIAADLPHPLTYLLCGILMGRQQLALAIMMHDGAHKRIFKSVLMNEYAGQFLTAAPLFFSMFSYRTLHLKHHRDPLVAEDPDLSLTGGYPLSKSSFLRKLLRDLTGVSYFKFIRYFIYLARGKTKKTRHAAATTGASTTLGEDRIISDLNTQSAAVHRDKLPLWMTFFSMIFMNLLIFGSLYYSGHGALYLLWLIPMMTVLQVLLRIRGVAEHAGYQPNKDQRLNSRTVISPVQTFFLAPHGVYYHVEHHVYPSVPFYRLNTVHKLMKERGSLPESNVFYGYGEVLKQIVK
jgi:fatty acid desaturase